MTLDQGVRFTDLHQPAALLQKMCLLDHSCYASMVLFRNTKPPCCVSLLAITKTKKHQKIKTFLVS